MTSTLIVEGGHLLQGTIRISGSKNSAVAVMIAALLSRSRVTLRNIPDIEDVRTILSIFTQIGVKTNFSGSLLLIDASEMNYADLLGESIRLFRASYYFMGVFLALYHHLVIHAPGGCNIGERPIDLHLFGLEALGVTYTMEDGIYHFKAYTLCGTEINFPKVSVGATINVMLLATLTPGKTILHNVAKEPEIEDVAKLINAMGGEVRGAGTDTLTIIGTTALHGAKMTIIPDRIECGTYALIGAALAKRLRLFPVYIPHLYSLIDVLRRVGASVEIGADSLVIRAAKNLQPITIRTEPYPGFPTDLQQPLTTLLTQAGGTSEIVETIYQERTAHLPELQRMGANVDCDGNCILIQGKTPLRGSEVSGKDLRGGASLIFAALLAEGKSVIHGLKYVNRGYGNIAMKLKAVGAQLVVLDQE